ncbi:phage tail protein [Photobacterium halotolerans]|uniref:Tail protein n=1 Tax=Photobacterium halotolerans TaxID=265726 RepID=A0A0F5VIR2_9GAMM|nr:phage tail protein [Photobacterium halotolerans]KKD01390.1 hypothetical protein KY46_00735 [Photobacterium halotolerans]
MTQYQAGYKLRDLKAHISQCVGEPIAKHLSAEMSNIELELSPRHMGHGVVLAYQRYTAEFYFDRFPFRKYDPAVLFANVAAWLMDNDSERDQHRQELGDPSIDVVMEDEHSAEVIIEVTFEEPINLIEDDTGGVFWQGKRWRIAEYEVWVAERLRDVVIR